MALKETHRMKMVAGYEAHLGLLWWLRGTEFAYNAGDPSWTPESRRSPGGGHGNPLQYSCLENHMDRGAWQLQPLASQSQTWLKLLSMHAREERVCMGGESGLAVVGCIHSPGVEA